MSQRLATLLKMVGDNQVYPVPLNVYIQVVCVGVGVGVGVWFILNNYILIL